MGRNVINKRHFKPAALFFAAVAGVIPFTPSLAQSPKCKGIECDNPFGAILVTATRRDAIATSVPLSLVATSREELAQNHITSIEDLSRSTPGLSFRNGWGDATKISIRGIASGVGASTTGIYIDDTPIHVRALGAADIFSNSYPEIFDLERVEVLRGPQGTLFGSGSQGGTIRFITAQPSLDETHVYGKLSLATTRGGSASWSAGASAQAPISEGRLGLALSAFTKKDGGWIDRAPHGSDVVVDKNINKRTATAIRGAMTFAANDQLTITPALYYQKSHRHDTDQYWELPSNPSDNHFVSGAPTKQPARDRFLLPSLKVELSLGNATLISNTSLFDRKNTSNTDYSYHLIEGGTFILSGGEFILHDLIPANFRAPSAFNNKQKGFTQEIRLQSDNPDSAIQWTGGIFYQRTRQSSTQDIIAPLFPDYAYIFTNGMSVSDVFGVDMLSGGRPYASEDRSRDTQIAGFGQVDWQATDKLTLSVGGRIARTNVRFSNWQDGPLNFGPLASSGKSKETPFTPKFSASYQPDASSLIYANIAKGFRPGGGNTAVSALCAPDLNDLGLSVVPASYKSDHVWSYELGVKKSDSGGRFTAQASAFWIDWNHIQQSLPLVRCGFAYTANLGKAVSRGIDAQLSVKPVDGVTLKGSVAYTDAYYSNTVVSDANALLVSKGDMLPGSPWQVHLSALYDFDIAAHKAFVRAHYDYASAYDRLPNAPAFSADTPIQRAGATHFVGARAGVTIGSVQAALFVDNLLDSHDSVFRMRDSIASDYFRRRGLRPRTVGFELTFKN